MAETIFTSTLPVELHSVEGAARTALVEPPAEGEKGHPLVIETLRGTGKNYPLLSAIATVGPISWTLKGGAHTMRSASSTGEPSFIFSMVNEKNPELFYCVVMPKDTPKDELGMLEDVLGKLTHFHATKPKAPALELPNLPKISLPHIDMPKIDASGVTNKVEEVLRKGAEDTTNMLKSAGEAAQHMFHAAADMHKKYAPKPAEQPMEVNASLRDKIAKSKQATAAGAAVAKGVATGMQAATVEIGTSLASVVAGEDKGKKGAAAASSSSGLMARPEVKAVGGVGMEILRDIAAVRDAMVNTVGTAWNGLKEATVEVFDYQYGDQAAATVQDASEVVEGIANMGLAMKLTQPGQVLLTSAKETKETGGQGHKNAADSLAAEKQALEKELARLKAEKAAIEGGDKKGPFGLPFGIGGGKK